MEILKVIPEHLNQRLNSPNFGDPEGSTKCKSQNTTSTTKEQQPMLLCCGFLLFCHGFFLFCFVCVWLYHKAHEGTWRDFFFFCRLPACLLTNSHWHILTIIRELAFISASELIYHSHAWRHVTCRYFNSMQPHTIAIHFPNLWWHILLLQPDISK